MKKITTILSAIVLLCVLVIACQPSKNKDEKSEVKSMDSTSNEQMATVQYTCPMHPDVVVNAPGSCPKCGMDLVKKEGATEPMEGDSTGHNH